MRIRSAAWLILIGVAAVVLLDIGTHLPTPDDRSQTRRTVQPRSETGPTHTDANEPQTLLAKAYDLTKNNRHASALALLKQLQQNYPNFQPDKVSAAVAEFTSANAERDKEHEEERAKQEAEHKRLAEQERLEQERVAREKAEAFAKAEKYLVKSRDEMQEVDWYRHAWTPKANDEKNIHAYIGKKGDIVWLRLKITYGGSDWLFVRSALFKVDGETFELRYGLLDDWNRDHSGSGIWEWKDVVVDAYTWKLINKIADSQKAMMRYQGQQYYFDREVDSAEKLALIDL